MADVDGLQQRVQRILLDHDFTMEVKKQGLLVPYESTMVLIVCGELSDERTVVILRGQVAQDVPISAELKAFIAEESAKYIFGHPAYLEGEGKAYIEFRHALLGEFLDPDELLVALAQVAIAANDMDDVIHDRFGGERWIDPHPTA